MNTIEACGQRVGKGEFESPASYPVIAVSLC